MQVQSSLLKTQVKEVKSKGRFVFSRMSQSTGKVEIIESSDHVKVTACRGEKHCIRLSLSARLAKKNCRKYRRLEFMERHTKTAIKFYFLNRKRCTCTIY